MTADSMDYEALVHSALRGVVRGALARVAESGLPGAHHFYIEFRTDAPGVDLAPRLRARFPERMTIVLQHQFHDLEVGGDGFAVTLSFDGKHERLAVPFDAVAAFTDPEASFALQFDPLPAPADEAEDEVADRAEVAPATGDAPAGKADGNDADAPDGDTVVAVDFRRRKADDGAHAGE